MTTENKRIELKGTVSMTLRVLSFLFYFICAGVLLFTLIGKQDPDGAVRIGNRQMRVVLSDSMAPNEKTDVSSYKIGSIKKRSLVFIETVPEDPAAADEWYAALRDGDVLTFRYVYITQMTITHRVVGDPVKNPGGGYTIHLRGDNGAGESGSLTQTINTALTHSPNYVIGKVTGQNRLFGLIITALQDPIGIVLAIILPCAVIAVLEVLRLRTLWTGKGAPGSSVEIVFAAKGLSSPLRLSLDTSAEERAALTRLVAGEERSFSLKLHFAAEEGKAASLAADCRIQSSSGRETS